MESGREKRGEGGGGVEENSDQKLTVSTILAVGDGMKSKFLLLGDNVLDILVLNKDELFALHFAGRQKITLLKERLCAEQRAQMLCAERRIFVTGHDV